MSPEATGLNPSKSNWVRANYHDLKHLPEPGERWSGADVDYTPGEISLFHQNNAIDQIRNGDRDKDGNRYYRTNRKVWNAVQMYLDEYDRRDRLLPCEDDECPGKGFVTTSEGLECKGCGEVHGKEDLQR